METNALYQIPTCTHTRATQLIITQAVTFTVFFSPFFFFFLFTIMVKAQFYQNWKELPNSSVIVMKLKLAEVTIMPFYAMISDALDENGGIYDHMFHALISLHHILPSNHIISCTFPQSNMLFLNLISLLIFIALEGKFNKFSKQHISFCF